MQQKSVYAMSNSSTLYQRLISRGIPESLALRIMNEPESFTNPLRNNAQIRDFPTFESEFKKHMAGSGAYKYFFEDTDYEMARIAFRSEPVRFALERNIGKKEADKLYTEEEISASPTVVVEPQQKITAYAIPARQSVKSYPRIVNNKTVQVIGYQKMRPSKFSEPQSIFLRTRHIKKTSLKSVIAQYRMTYKSDNRSDVSIKTKFYRS